MTTSQQFPVFLREHGAIRIPELAEPQPTLVKKLPVSSAIHYLGNDEVPELDVSDPLMLGYSKKVRYFNVTKYDPSHTGGVRKLIDMAKINALFDKVNTGFKVFRDLKEVQTFDSQSLVVFNYGYLDEIHTYQDNKLAQYAKIDNKLWSLIETIKEVSKISDRNQFVMLNIPAMLIPKTIMDSRSMDEISQLSNVFKTLDQHLMRQMWVFLNPNTQSRSIWGTLTDAQKQKVNLVWRTFDGKCVIVNLAYIYSWVNGNPNLTMLKSVLSKPYTEVQKTYLRGNMVMQTINDAGVSERAQEDAQNAQMRKVDAIEAQEQETGASNQDERFLQDQEYEQTALQAEARLRQARAVPGDDQRGVLAKDAKRSQDTEQQEVETVTSAAIDADIQALEELYLKQVKIQQKKADAKQVPQVPDTTEVVAEEQGYTSDIPESKEELEEAVYKTRSPQEVLKAKLDILGASGRLSAVEYRKKLKLIELSSTLPDPYGSGKTIAEASIVTKEDLVITDKEASLNVPETVIDQSMARATLSVINEKYNQKTINKDILNCIQHAQKGGVIIRSHTVDVLHEATGSSETHTLEFVPLNGTPSIIRMTRPLVDDDGVIEARGSRYSFRSQFCDVPIRKIGAHRVGLTSYDKKSFVDRATKKANSSLEYVLTRLSKATVSPDEYLRDVAPGDVFDNYFEAPYFYSGISEKVMSFKAGDINFDFNHKGFRATLDQKILDTFEKNGTRICGWIAKGNKSLVTIDKKGDFHAVRANETISLGDIFDILKLDKRLAPIDFAEVKVFSKGIPVGIFIAQSIGLRKLVKLTGAKHRISPGKRHKDVADHEYVVQFRDVAYIFDKRDAQNTLIFAGFNEFDKEIKLYDAEIFDNKDIYTKLLEIKGLSSIYLMEMENLNDMFIDPITLRILEEMKEPTTFIGLLIRSCELLGTYYYPLSQDADFQRIRGYDRFAGFMYKELTQSIRSYKSRNRTGRAKVEMSPYQLWTTITRDSSVKHAEDINPIQSLKISEEAVTYVGEGGRGKESMNRASRAYTVSNLGTLSEASVDSSDVGINAFLAADPGFATTDGIKKKDVPLKSANLLSTSVLLSPFAMTDDMKRVGFISIQQGHTVPTEGYTPSMIRTGYESVLGMRTNSMFAKTAKGDGEVVSVGPKGIIVKYKDGEEKGYPLGTLYGKAEGSVYPNTLTTDLKVGDKLKKNDYITYNTKFFEKDPVLPGGVVYKGSLMARIALMEVAETHEDSSSISERLSERLRTQVIKPKQYVVNFRQNVTNVVKVGQRLKPEDILMSIEDEITASDSSFQDVSLQILSDRSKNSPRSSYVGTVTGIEVIYNGRLEDMSDGLKALAKASDKTKAEEAKARNLPYASGYDRGETTIDGTPLAPNKAVIKVYINVSDNASSGDKLVYCHQIKSVIGEVMPYTLRTESGDIVDAKVGAKSFAARIVGSLLSVGLRSTLLDVTGYTAVKLYEGQT